MKPFGYQIYICNSELVHSLLHEAKSMEQLLKWSSRWATRCCRHGLPAQMETTFQQNLTSEGLALDVLKVLTWPLLLTFLKDLILTPCRYCLWAHLRLWKLFLHVSWSRLPQTPVLRPPTRQLLARPRGCLSGQTLQWDPTLPDMN